MMFFTNPIVVSVSSKPMEKNFFSYLGRRDSDDVLRRALYFKVVGRRE